MFCINLLGIRDMLLHSISFLYYNVQIIYTQSFFVPKREFCGTENK